MSDNLPSIGEIVSFDRYMLPEEELEHLPECDVLFGVVADRGNNKNRRSFLDIIIPGRFQGGWRVIHVSFNSAKFKIPDYVTLIGLEDIISGLRSGKTLEQITGGHFTENEEEHNALDRFKSLE